MAIAPQRSVRNARERLIVALDVASEHEATQLVDELLPLGVSFKIGLQLFTSAGPGIVRKIAERGGRVFLDLKFHDIPNTVAAAAVEAARIGVWMFNVHASGGSEMMKRTVGSVNEAVERDGLNRPLIIAVTVLTSSAQATLDEIGVSSDVESSVLRLVRLTSQSGLDGVVASAVEAPSIRHTVADPAFLIVTPGIRPASATNDDQKRVMTPAAALRAGSDHLVIGRPITSAPSPAAAAQEILNELENAFE